MPLVILAKGKVVHQREPFPTIGCRANENRITQQNKNLLASHMLSKSMSIIQQSLLKETK
jgi:hypothetical protein